MLNSVYSCGDKIKEIFYKLFHSLIFRTILQYRIEFKFEYNQNASNYLLL